MKKILSWKWGFLILIIAGVLVFFTLSFSEGFVSFGLNPIQNIYSHSAERIKNFFTYFDDIGELRSENEILRNQLSELTSNNLKLSNDLENTGIILDEYEYITNHEFNSVLGKVISRGSDNYLQTLIINKGIKDGIQIGYPAVVQNGYIIGKVIETNNFSSKILLINDIHSKLSVNINNEDHSPGIVTGEFGLSLQVDMIPYDHQIEVGQMVITSGLENNIPGELIVGTITNIIKKEGELFQVANLVQIENIENTKILTIILPN
ncbi:MAG: rod shape-determining protein MreC [bacterium]|nr:rod shape-determining protein MreC [bacterium]